MSKKKFSEEELAAAFLAKAVGTRLNEVDAAHIYKGTHAAKNINPADFLNIDPGEGRRGPAVRQIKDPNIIQAPKAKSLGTVPAGTAPANLDLIPMPEDIREAMQGNQMSQPPQMYPPQMQQPAPQPQPQPVAPAKDEPQLEFGFDVTGQGKDVPQNMPELYQYLEDRFTQIDIRLNNLFDMVKTVLPKRRVARKTNGNSESSK